MRFPLAIALVLCVAFLFGRSTPVLAQNAVEVAPESGELEQPRKRGSKRSRRKESEQTQADTDGSLRAVGKAKLNEAAVFVLSGNRDGQSLGFASDIAAVLDEDDLMRVLPIAGKGGAQNVRDILWLRGIDMGITQTNVLNHLAKTGELGSIKGQIAYIAKLFNEEMHILAKSDIKSLEDLRGKKVNFGEVGSGTEITAELIFKQLGLNNVTEVNLGPNEAIGKIKSGEIAATILISGKPSPGFIHIKASEGLKLLSLPYRPDMDAEIYPAVLTHSDYPDLIAEDEIVETIAVCSALTVFNWTDNGVRGKRVGRFVNALFDKFAQLHQPPRHPKWREVNFAATLEGWTRHPAAQEWIDKANPQVAADQRADFETFMAESGEQGSAADDGEPETAGQREALFKAYLEWSKRREQN